MNNALEKPKFNDEETDIAPKVFGFAALGVMAAMFALMGFSMTIIIFLVLVGYFVWRAVARTEMHEVRGIFEFYLAANEILRDDERRWYGFEIQDVISRGHRILGMMPDAPPLVHFALGALHHRAGNHQQAENHLAFVLEDTKADERNRLTASAELRSYVRILRKLEREPAEAPQTTAAIRALERSRRHRAAILLQESRQKAKEALAAAKAKETKELSAAPLPKEPVKPLLERLAEPAREGETAPPKQPASVTFQLVSEIPSKPANGNGSVTDAVETTAKNGAEKTSEKTPEKSAEPPKKEPKPPAPKAEKDKMHKPISEVLRDIYD